MLIVAKTPSINKARKRILKSRTGDFTGRNISKRNKAHPLQRRQRIIEVIILFLLTGCSQRNKCQPEGPDGQLKVFSIRRRCLSPAREVLCLASCRKFVRRTANQHVPETEKGHCDADEGEADIPISWGSIKASS